MHSHSVELVVKSMQKMFFFVKYYSNKHLLFPLVVQCPDLNLNKTNLKTLSNGGNKMSAKITFECNLGTRMVGPPQIECLPTGKWSNSVPSCAVTECPDLSLVDMNDVVPKIVDKSLPKVQTAQIIKNQKSVGESVVFTCPKGYGLHGPNHELVCLSNGQWSGSVPYCQEVKCSPPLAPENGFLDGITDIVGPYFASDLVQYACLPGYMLDGNPISICQENGRWSGPLPRCKPACTYPGLMHGSRLISDIKFHYEINETIEFDCVDGYEMRGNSRIKCIDKGQWSGSIPSCQVKTDQQQ